ncbi:MAG TPA: hypothetical protein VGA37_01205 [Gemmatimonadales bacterium]
MPFVEGESPRVVAFVDGWAFSEVIATQGGTPRRLTVETSEVYQSGPQ